MAVVEWRGWWAGWEESCASGRRVYGDASRVTGCAGGGDAPVTSRVCTKSARTRRDGNQCGQRSGDDGVADALGGEMMMMRGW